VLYEGRLEAGQVLAGVLRRLELGPCVVAGIPRGGIVVAEPIAQQLGAPLVAVSARKLSTPEAPDCPFGAVDEDGNAVLDHRTMVMLGLGASDVDEIKTGAAEEMARRLAAHRGPRLSDCAPGRTVVIVDDGLVSGLSMRVAIACARRHGARGTVVAVPCASDRASFEVGSLLCETHDRLVCPRGDPCLLSEGDYYRDLLEVSDEDVAQILENAAATCPASDNCSSRLF